MKRTGSMVLWALLGVMIALPAVAGPVSTAIRDSAEYVMTKFGRGVAGQTVEEVTDTTARAITRHGDEVLPLVRATGHQGFEALEQAGEQAPEVIKLYARRGDDAVWVISEPKKLAIFLKHGDSAADALIKHPGLAEDLIGRFGDDAADALSGVSKQSAQRLGIVAEDGVLTASLRSPDLLSVVRRYGDGAMDFIWKNKGALTVTTVLGTFLADPQSYISGAKQLIVEPVLAPIARNTNWTWIIAGVLVVVLLAFIARTVALARTATRRRGHARP